MNQQLPNITMTLPVASQFHHQTTTTIKQASTIARGKYRKRKLNNIIEAPRQNIKGKEDNIEQTLKILITHMEKMDKRIEHLEEKFTNKDNNNEKNTLEGEIPSQIKT